MEKIRFVKVSMRHLKKLNQIINNSDVARFTSMTPPCPMKETIKFFKSMKAQKNFWWAIILGGEIAGSIGLMRKASGRQIKKMGHRVEIGITIDKKFWKMGIGKDSMRFAEKEAKRHGFKKIELYVIKDNRHAVRLYRKIGFKKEGIVKCFMLVGGNYRDAIMMAKWLG